jgi:hypothetical protein
MFLDGANDNLYKPSRFTIGKRLGYSLIAAKRRLTTPMHTDRRELIGYDAKVICGG